MGMAWDIGAPLWPYQTSDILLRFLNGPAYFIAMPISYVLRLAAPKQHLLVLPAILIWWWFLGLILDRGLARTDARRRWPLFGISVVLAVLFLWAATAISGDALRWWFRVGGFDRSGILLMLRFLSPAAWCIALACLLIVKAKRLAIG
jgi:hypothetical protein